MKRGLLVLTLVGFVVSLCGCVSGRPEGRKAEEIAVETVRTAVVSVREAEAFVEDGRLVVAGELRRVHEVSLPGHVDVSLCGPEGILEKRSVKVPGLSSKKSGVMDLPFRTHFDQAPPQGSKVQVRYHAAPFEGEDHVTCG